MTSQKISKMSYVNGVNVAKHGHVAGEVSAISDCLVLLVIIVTFTGNGNLGVH